MDKNEMKLQARKAVAFVKANKQQLAIAATIGLGTIMFVKYVTKPFNVDLDKTEELIKWTETGLLLDGVHIVIPKSENWYVVKDTTVSMADIVAEIVKGDITTIK